MVWPAPFRPFANDGSKPECTLLCRSAQVDSGTHEWYTRANWEALKPLYGKGFARRVDCPPLSAS